jgi:RNA polymerase sigma factor (sigma-70 family)
MEDCNVLLIKYRKLFEFLAKKAQVPGYDWEDLQQELMIHFFKNFKKYSPEKSSLKTFITRISNNKIKDLKRFVNSKKRFGDFHHLSIYFLEQINPQNYLLSKSFSL